jgi:hypothetical protein
MLQQETYLYYGRQRGRLIISFCFGRGVTHVLTQYDLLLFVNRWCCYVKRRKAVVEQNVTRTTQEEMGPSRHRYTNVKTAVVMVIMVITITASTLCPLIHRRNSWRTVNVLSDVKVDLQRNNWETVKSKLILKYNYRSDLCLKKVFIISSIKQRSRDADISELAKKIKRIKEIEGLLLWSQESENARIWRQLNKVQFFTVSFHLLPDLPKVHFPSVF